ncbi:beta-N-acetylhexosaminidase [Hasllibacter halocynthiae]|uniref:beta-N-acetylhexosaminidase n=1 Tax=Hasllibacter halocynthiae TaxID=595589 RepID=A0A2T0X7I9_9RHOB|nr:glycoside hydrolase family 3 N-terminal domain-containing protein [Hasllibacter halocynthiae]PRY94887.1 beta-N-acetylhexosaminidase [Hasllibacter halocynthiae]
MPGAYAFGCAGTTITPGERAFFREADPWGFILFARNVQTKDQLRALTGDLREAVGRHVPILIDQEGGRVQRMGPPVWRRYLPALDAIRAAGERPERAMWIRQRLISQELHEVGIDVNCVPCLDLLYPRTHPILANRLYGSTVEEVVRIARAVVAGGKAGGVLPVVKHLPGYGRMRVDPHLGLPRLSAPVEELSDTDFAPFREFADEAMGMTAHVLIPQIDETTPVTLSREGIDFLRAEMGWDALLMTDDISMEALQGTAAERGERAVAAGCDVVLHCNGEMAEMEGIAARCGMLSNGALRRAAAVPPAPAPQESDIPALIAEYEEIVGRVP